MSNEPTIPKPPKVVVAPEGCATYFTEGKEYNVIKIWDAWDEWHGYGFWIYDDNGNKRRCIEMNSAQLNFGNWIIKEREA